MRDYSKEWAKAELSEGKEPLIPPIGQSVTLYLRPRVAGMAFDGDIGSLYVEEEADAPLWGSAFGIDSRFDGMKFEDILKDYEVCFTAVPPLEAGRLPLPLSVDATGRAAAVRP